MSASIIANLKLKLAEKLPGDEAHLMVIPMTRLKERKELANEEFRKSAVSIILHGTEETLKCILIQRPDYDGAHSGQVSFPGGKQDPTDRNLIHTAIRECQEEINLTLSEEQLVGALTEVYIPVSRFKVQPYIFYVEQLSDLIPDNREVASIFDFDISLLQETSIIKRTNIRLHPSYTLKDVPYFDLNNKIVWGATAMMLAELKLLLDRIR